MAVTDNGREGPFRFTAEWISDYKNGYFWLIRGCNNSRVTHVLPYVDTRRYEGKCTINELKGYLETNDGKRQHIYRLAALYTQSVLSIDYGCHRPLLIIDKQSSPKAYTMEQIKGDLYSGIDKYRRWYWKLFHFFIKPTQEYTLLLNLIGLVSKEGIGINIEELTSSILGIHSSNNENNDS